MDKILLIDGMNLLWRSSVIFPDPKHKKNNLLNCLCGAEWNREENQCSVAPSKKNVIIYNFFRNLRPLIELFSPDKCFIVWEGHPQFRYDLYPQYKGNRIVKYATQQTTANRVFLAQEEIFELLKYLPITSAKAEKYECDDVIALLAENLREEDVTIISNDSDFIQLLQKGYNNCKIYNPIKKQFVECPAYHYLCFKSLKGDKADNIAGLVSENKAIKLASSPELMEKFLETEEHRALFSINKKLIEFYQFSEEEIIFQEGVAAFDKLKVEFNKLEFKSITNDKSWRKFQDTFLCIKY